MSGFPFDFPSFRSMTSTRQPSGKLSAVSDAMAGFFLTVLGSYSSVGLTRDKMNTSANVGMIYFH